MRYFAFASRNRKEIFRDPLNLLFGLGLPVVMMWIFSVMQKNMPFDLYNIEKLTPGIIVFSFSFITLFSGMLIGRDRSSSFLLRIFASPMSASDYIVGYAFPLLPVATLQIIVCFITAFFFGLSFNANVLLTIVVLIIIAMLYIGFGLLLGTYFTDKQVGGIFAIFVNLTTWLSGTWFDLAMIGGAFKTIAYALPFAHAVEATRAALAGEYGELAVPLLWVIGYTIVIFVIAVTGFKKKMKS
ncbi:ABC transporter permease [Paenibacillus apiarius]|uniref:Transport permease protein n=1 Tax=Paenibacillus apiarius TaxID=46240 RepID=A0ABT4E1X2_9BACL|nr:ABC transporter permease [Paenibacillus apiarius]MCY9517818.1 ABC transporter permease [Paenibacillus apiarius]MCY9522328.1 ABC transporter permease [Paenibacillus apiarius]MCY9555107.1 ABC transporter permease [Paenibacillus apiarius]MCY9558203.1 ABC transporter permease [Paenibacillus apiarius]MCY9684603.1 ABC transporter permease [Paenibacillus apiarius]